MSSTEHIPILIVGGGIVGLTASLFLSHYGVKCIVVERHTGTSIHPRARSVNARTMELFRRLGITDLVREAGASMRPTGGILKGRTLAEVIEPRPRKDSGGKSPFSGFLTTTSPEEGAFVTQDKLEPVLVKEACKRGVDIRFGHECTSVIQDSGSVTADLRERGTGREYIIEAQYLIAADGARSPIREHLNIDTTGRGTLGHLLNILFRADMSELVRGREFSLCVIDQPDISGVFTSIDNDKTWVLHLSFDPANDEEADGFPLEKCKEILRKAIGIPDLGIEVKSAMPWEPSAKVAKRMRKGRIFLAGDAAHQVTPYAGQGANGGIADVHNLAWKLATVLNGQASTDLLDTYEAERLPVGQIAAEVSAIGCDDRGMPPVPFSPTFMYSAWKKIFIIAGFGYRYASKAICAESTWPLGGWSWRPWTVPSLMFALDGRPGRRVPHVWIERKGERISTLDVCGERFVLLAGAEGGRWIRAAEELSLSLSVEIDAYVVGEQGDLLAPTGHFEAANGVSETGVILVRPDDYIAFRSRRIGGSWKSELRSAIEQTCCLE